MALPPYLNVEWNGARQPVPTTNPLEPADPGTWTTIRFDTVVAGGSIGQFSAPYNLASGGTGGVRAFGVVDLWLEDFPGANGSQCQIRQYEVNGSGSRVETSDSHEFQTQAAHSDPNRAEVTHLRYPVLANVNPGHRLRLELTQFHDSDGWDDGYIRKAQFTGFYWLP